MNNKFIFRLAPPPKAKKPAAPKKISRLVKGLCFKDEDGNWKVKVNISEDEALILDFTEDSFSLKGREIIFSKEKDKTNHYIAIRRSKQHALVFPGSDEHFTSLADKHVFSGYIVEENKTKLFKLHEYLYVIGHENDNAYVFA